MPCTAKKAEAQRPEFATGGQPDVDYVLTTQELARMIEEAGLRFNQLLPESFDMPLGFKTGAGVIFGATGGVTEAVLRYAVEKVNGVRLTNVDFTEVRGAAGVREASVQLMGKEVKLCVVHGLANARRVAEWVAKGEADYDLVEVMACPGGCIGGAGQPVGHRETARQARTRGLYEVDKMLQLHKSQDNHLVAELYRDHLGQPGSAVAHELLHTHYHSRRRLFGSALSLTGEGTGDTVEVCVCVGTNCYVKGSQDLLRAVMQHVSAEGLNDRVAVRATFCLERCGHGPNVAIDGEVHSGCTLAKVQQALAAKLGVVR
jgi:NADH-quinone oxidoreductase subunit G